MPRKPRFTPAGYYLHITQRGNYRQRTFFSDLDRIAFLDLLAYHASTRQVDLLGFSLMSNHFHLIARGSLASSIPAFMRGLSGQYSQFLHGRLTRRGRLWQNRYYSCVLSDSHLFTALRYVELNPVRAGIITAAADYPWSSAAIHTGAPNPNIPDSLRDVLDLATFDRRQNLEDWKSALFRIQPSAERAAIRLATQTEAPLGDAGFIDSLEQQFQVSLRSKSPGRPPITVSPEATAQRKPAAKRIGRVAKARQAGCA